MVQYSRRYEVVMSKWHFTWCWNAFITLVTLHNSKLPDCIYTEGHIAFIPGRFALKHMYMSYCTFAMSDCISQMLKTHFGNRLSTSIWLLRDDGCSKYMLVAYYRRTRVLISDFIFYFSTQSSKRSSKCSRITFLAQTYFIPCFRQRCAK